MGVIKYILFDLDNTLYSRRYGLEDEVYRRIMEFAGAYLGISPDEARHQRVTAKVQYGTSLEWLMTEEGFTDVEAFLASVHPPGETAPLSPDRDLRAFLDSIPIPKAILTNSPMEHALAVLEKLDIANIFTHIFDIRSSNFIGKPHRESFENALHTLGVSAKEVLFIDDYPLYVEGFIAIGGNGLLIDEDDMHKDSPLPKIRDLREITGYLAH